MLASLLKRVARPLGVTTVEHSFEEGGGAAADMGASDPRLRYCAVIDMHGDDFEAHRQEITQHLMDAAKSIGFFQVRCASGPSLTQSLQAHMGQGPGPPVHAAASHVCKNVAYALRLQSLFCLRATVACLMQQQPDATHSSPAPQRAVSRADPILRCCRRSHAH